VLGLTFALYPEIYPLSHPHTGTPGPRIPAFYPRFNRLREDYLFFYCYMKCKSDFWKFGSEITIVHILGKSIFWLLIDITQAVR